MFIVFMKELFLNDDNNVIKLKSSNKNSSAMGSTAHTQTKHSQNDDEGRGVMDALEPYLVVNREPIT